MARKKIGRARIVFVLSLLACITYFYLTSEYVSVSMADNEFGDYLQLAVNLVVAQNRDAEDLRNLVLAKARELNIPLNPMNIAVDGSGREIELRVSYGITIALPVLANLRYRREFEHEVTYRPAL
jgi:hypothetical protein